MDVQKRIVLLLLVFLNCSRGGVVHNNNSADAAFREKIDLQEKGDLKLLSDLKPSDGPNGFLFQFKRKGVVLYKKEHIILSPRVDYVWEVDLKEGAKIRSFTEQVVGNDDPNPYPLVGPNPVIVKSPLMYFWTKLEVLEPNLMVVMNASAFDRTRAPTPLLWTVKQDGVVVSVGSNMFKWYHYPGHFLLLRLDYKNNTTDIKDFNKDEGEFQKDLVDYDTVFAALEEDAQEKNPEENRARLMAGVSGSKVYIFCSLSAKIIDTTDRSDGAATILRSFGALGKVVLFDDEDKVHMLGKDSSDKFVEYVVQKQNVSLPQIMYIQSGN